MDASNAKYSRVPRPDSHDNSTRPATTTPPNHYENLLTGNPDPLDNPTDDMISAILLIIITLFVPPIGVFLVAGCGPDLLINILLTVLGYFPGHIHAFYVEYVYYKRRDEMRAGMWRDQPAPGVYSERVLRGGEHGGYAQQQPVLAPGQAQPAGYGTVA